MRARIASALIVLWAASAFGQAPEGDVLPDTERLELAEPLDVAMVKGINAFAEQEIALSRERRARHWKRDYSSPEAYEKSVAPNRERLKTFIGAVDERVPPTNEEKLFETWFHLFDKGPDRGVMRYTAFEGVNFEAYLVDPRKPGGAYVLLIPDADWIPEQMTGEVGGVPKDGQIARRLLEYDVGSIVIPILNRSSELSGHPEIRQTNQSHREFIYRPAFELGRHVIGYEVQRILTLVDHLAINQSEGLTERPIIVWGVGEGGLLAMYAAAVDPRIDACVVSGYFSEREDVWKEPIYRNVWRLLDEFGDAEIAGLIAPRQLIVEACSAPEVNGPPASSDSARGAAPGAIVSPELQRVEREFATAKTTFEALNVADNIRLVRSGADGNGPPCAAETLQIVLKALEVPAGEPKAIEISTLTEAEADVRDQRRQGRLFNELRQHTQQLLHASDKARDKVWSKADRSSLAAWEKTQEEYRDLVYDELIGRISYGLLDAHPRSRKVIDEPTHVGYEVALDVFRSEWDDERAKAQGLQPLGVASEPIIAGGILLVPKDLKPGEKRPCVVCQHGLEGTPMDTIATDPNHSGYGPYKGFSTQLVQRGFIVYAPQNPYRGQDEFRVIQRKSNPLGRSLFSYIIPQHQQTLNWLATLPYIDSDRIAFYGLSYGGKTAMRVPPMLPPRQPGTSEAGAATPGAVGYCLSICSADFNEWVLKNASTEDRYSYVYTGEYEIFEWNMGHVANYAELASLMTPRPFMVERGHDDGVAPDEWVAWEYAKVKRHYDKLGIGDRTEMEVFNGPHTINGKGTFDFLHKHLNWPKPE